MAKDDKDDDLVGKVEEAAGWLTGDREVEAKGKLRRLAATEDGEADDEDAATAEAAERDVRAGYGEYDPNVDGEPTAKDPPGQ